MKTLLKIAFGFLLYPVFVDSMDVLQSNVQSETLENVYYKVWMPSYGLAKPFTKGCTKDVSTNGHGWVFVNREYYQCNKLQIVVSDYIFGEYTKDKK